MSYANPIWPEGQRRYWLRHDWQRFIRHDAHRFLTPAGIAEEKRAAEAETAAGRNAAEIDAAELAALRADHARVRIELADVKFALVLRRIFHKYNPDQPRDERGRWTNGTGGPSSTASPQGNEALRTNLTQVLRICMAGSSSITTDQWGNQKYRVEYVCADGFVFNKSGLGSRFRAFLRDP